MIELLPYLAAIFGIAAVWSFVNVIRLNRIIKEQKKMIDFLDKLIKENHDLTHKINKYDE